MVSDNLFRFLYLDIFNEFKNVDGNEFKKKIRVLYFLFVVCVNVFDYWCWYGDVRVIVNVCELFICGFIGIRFEE